MSQYEFDPLGNAEVYMFLKDRQVVGVEQRRLFDRTRSGKTKPGERGLFVDGPRIRGHVERLVEALQMSTRTRGTS